MRLQPWAVGHLGIVRASISCSHSAGIGDKTIAARGKDVRPLPARHGPALTCRNQEVCRARTAVRTRRKIAKGQGQSQYVPDGSLPHVFFAPDGADSIITDAGGQAKPLPERTRAAAPPEGTPKARRAPEELPTMQSVFVRSHKPLKVELYNVQKLNTRPGSRDPQFEKEEPLPDFEALLEIAYADWTYDHEAGADSQEPAWVYEQEQRRLEISRAREQKQAEGRRARWLWFVRTHYSQIQGLEYMQKVELYWAWLAETGRISERRCRMAYGLRALLNIRYLNILQVLSNAGMAMGYCSLPSPMLPG